MAGGRESFAATSFHHPVNNSGAASNDAAVNTSYLLHARLRQAVITATALLVTFAVVRVAHIDGLLRRVTIDGPSMAPAWCGAHYDLRCADCGFSFRCDAEHVPKNERAACPNCGYTEIPLEQSAIRPPQSVLIDRWPQLGRAPARGDVVSFHEPSGGLAIKRVAALPGERLVIREGDLFGTQQPIRKTQSQRHAMRLLVHDNQHQPQLTTTLLNRWRGAAEKSRWQKQVAGYRIEPSTEANAAFDWLEYVHWPCTADSRTRGVASPILDNDSYNQGETKRSLNSVSDVMVSCRMRTTGTGRFALAAIDGDQRFEVEIQPEQRLVLRSGDQTLLDQPLKMTFVRRSGVHVEFGLCDQQVLLVIDGRTVLRHDYTRPDGPRPEPLHPLAIGAQAIGLEIDQLRVWRDIHYLDPQGLPRPWTTAAPLADGHFALLGDNQPVSIDSRHWEPVGIARHAILGHVYKPFWTAK